MKKGIFVLFVFLSLPISASAALDRIPPIWSSQECCWNQYQDFEDLIRLPFPKDYDDGFVWPDVDLQCSSDLLYSVHSEYDGGFNLWDPISIPFPDFEDPLQMILLQPVAAQELVPLHEGNYADGEMMNTLCYPPEPATLGLLALGSVFVRNFGTKNF